MLSRAFELINMRLPRMAKDDADRGQTLVEYALLLAFIAIVVVVVVVLLGPTVSAIFQSVNDQI